MTAPSDRVARVIGLYRATAESRTAIALLVANAIPLVGVLFLGWSLWTILVVYWLENGIVGAWNIPRILLAEGGILATGPSAAAVNALFGRSAGVFGRVATAAFFSIHYGIFWVVHGVFVFTLPLFAGLGGTANPETIRFPDGTLAFFDQPGGGGGSAFGEIAWSSVAVGAVAMVISHGASFFLNYLGQGEYHRATPLGEMAAPYGRVVVLHLTILIGAFAVALLGAPIVLLVILVVLKSALDIRLHLAERARLAAPQPPAEPRSTNVP